jgi:hypothetical protein
MTEQVLSTRKFSEYRRALEETVLPKNAQGGFLGQVGDRSTELVAKAIRYIKDAAKGHPAFDKDGVDDVQIGHFLDSPGGRHLGELMMDEQEPKVIKAFLSKSIERFARNYDAAAFDAAAGPKKRVEESTETYNSRQGTHGLFSMHPHRREKAIGGIKKLLRDPLRAHEASAKLSPHIPDPKLMDHINHFKNIDPSVDVRPVVKKRLRELQVKGF